MAQSAEIELKFTIERENREEIYKEHGNIYELQGHWQFIITFLQLNFFPAFFQVEFIPLPWGGGGAFGQNIYPCYFSKY